MICKMQLRKVTKYPIFLKRANILFWKTNLKPRFNGLTILKVQHEKKVVRSDCHTTHLSLRARVIKTPVHFFKERKLNTI